MFPAFTCEEMRLQVALLCAAYRTAWRKRLVIGGAVSLLFAPLLGHSFVRSIYIMSYTLTAVGGGGVSYGKRSLEWGFATFYLPLAYSLLSKIKKYALGSRKSRVLE